MAHTSSPGESRRPYTLCLARWTVPLGAATTCWLSALVVVPLLIAFVTIAGARTPLRFLLFPPLAALAYGILTNPDQPSANLRGIVVAPTLTAIVVLPISAYMGADAPAYAVAVLVTIVIMRLVGSTLVPPLALAVLIVLLRVRDPVFAVSVFVATLLLYAIFMLWKCLLERLHPRLTR